jgi:hypothetical protein
MSESTSLASQIGRASAVIMIWSMMDKILAIGKEVLTAHRFGVSASLDVFNLAYSFPGTIVLLFSSALVSAVVPLYLEWRSLSSREADSHATWLNLCNHPAFCGPGSDLLHLYPGNHPVDRFWISNGAEEVGCYHGAAADPINFH